MTNRRLLYVTGSDSSGSRFTGIDWIPRLPAVGYEARALVHWQHQSTLMEIRDLSHWSPLARTKLGKRIYWKTRIESGREGFPVPWSRGLFTSDWYKQADIVHLQVISDGTLDFTSIKRVLQEKPVVWTWHDFWVLTGHCIQPLDCAGFSRECKHCPHMDRPFAIRRDRAQENRSAKKLFLGYEFTVHVTTEWMADRVAELLPASARLRVVPFGVDAEEVESREFRRQSARARLNLPPNSFVVGVRATSEDYKNLGLLKAALCELGEMQLTCLTVDQVGLLDGLPGNVRVVDLGWRVNKAEMDEFLDALDVLIVPSTGETFGFVALEAMSRGVPVVAVRGTAVDEVVGASGRDLAVSAADSTALAELMKRLSLNPQEVAAHSYFVNERARSRFGIGDFIVDLKSMYDEALGW